MVNTEDIKRHSSEQEPVGYGRNDEVERRRKQEGRETGDSQEGILAATF